MGRLRSFLRLPHEKQRALALSLVVVTAVRSALWLLPFPVVRRILGRLARPPARSRPAVAQSEIDMIVWALSIAGRRFPAAGRCLIEALAGHVLLGRRGAATELRVGVARGPDGTFKAHAWLEQGGVVVIGELGADLALYTPFPALPGLEP